VCVLPPQRHRLKPHVASAFDSQLYDVFRIEVIGFFAKLAPAECRCPGRREISKDTVLPGGHVRRPVRQNANVLSDPTQTRSMKWEDEALLGFCE
jgi:hypothetical protein